jgi:hypothetical protein
MVLSKAEVAELKAATDATMQKIKAVATAKISFVDVNALLTQVATTDLRLMDLL